MEVDLCLAILSLLKAVAEIPGEVKVNKKQCKRLSERLLALERPINKLRAMQEGMDVQSKALKITKDIIDDSLKHMRKFTDRNWVRKAFNRKTDAEEFKSLNSRLQVAVADLHFEMAVDVAPAQFDRDEEDDWREMESLLEDLANNVGRVGSVVEKMQVEADAQHAEVLAALQSIRRKSDRSSKGGARGGDDGDHNERAGQLTEISLAELQLEERLGAGGFGEVWRGTWMGVQVAVKRLLAQSMDDTSLRALRNELSVHQSIHHPFVTQLLGACTKQKPFAIVLEFAPHGNAFSLLHFSDTPLSLALRVSMLLDVARGMQYLHSRRIVHRDLKSLNLLVFEDMRVKLCDFGLSKMKTASQSFATHAVGTTAWMAPEVLDDEDMEGEAVATEKGDVYAFAVVMYEFLARTVPYQGKKDGTIIGFVLKGKRLALPDDPNRPSQLDDLVTSCWHQDPACRPTFPTIVQRLEAMQGLVGPDPRRVRGDHLSSSSSSSSLSAAPAPAPAPGASSAAHERAQSEHASAADAELTTWLEEVGLAGFRSALREYGVSSCADLALLEHDDLAAVGMNPFQQRKFAAKLAKGGKGEEAAAKKGSEEASVVALKPEPEPAPPMARHPSRPVDSFVIKKGVYGEGRELTQAMLDKVAKSRFDPAQKKWVEREHPLTSEELECWVDQSKFLQCPITGRWWSEAAAKMGVGLYHAPRALSARELQRREAMDLQAALAKQGMSAHDRMLGGNHEWGWHSEGEFEVYPTVRAPDPKDLDDEEEAASHPNAPAQPMGHTEVVVGCAFDIQAYNWGVRGMPDLRIKPKKERGVLSMDQQFNALNYVFYVRKRADSNVRKLVTNRLSFFVEDMHGARVFPVNIRSQLSLLVYRQRDKLTDSDGGTDEVKLAEATRIAIPRILLASILEVFHGKATKAGNLECSEEYVDDAIRTFLLIHQVSIKIVVYFQKTKLELWRNVMEFVQDPFRVAKRADDGGKGPKRRAKQGSVAGGADGAGGDDGSGGGESAFLSGGWSSVEELIIGSAILGIPWAVIREAAVCRLFAEMLHTNAVAKNLSAEQVATTIFAQNRERLRMVLCVFSFCSVGRSAAELDVVYTRCAGTLPRQEREQIKARVLDVQSLSSLQEFWLRVGMEPTPCDAAETLHHIANFVAWVMSHKREWMVLGTTRVPDSRAPPPFDFRSLMEQVSQVGAAQSDSNEVLDKLRAYEEEQRALHAGYPQLNHSGKLDRTTCNYCGKTFRHRDLLFAHLNQYIGGARMVRGFHQTHWKRRFKHDEFHASLRTLMCVGCEQSFPSVAALQAHYREMGIGTNEIRHAKPVEAAGELHPGLFDDLDKCTLCGKGPRSAVVLPSGVRYACKPCAIRESKCAFTHSAIVDVVEVNVCP